MTPQEYIDRERRHARINLGWAKRSDNGAVIQQSEEKLQMLDEFERTLKALHRKKEACRLMRVAAKVLATVDSMDPDYSIVATLDGGGGTLCRISCLACVSW